MLARDRLLGTYEVSPVMSRLRKTMLSTGGGLVLAGVLLAGAVRAGSDADGMYGRGAKVTPATVTNSGIIYSRSIKDLATLLEDDEAAAAEQVRAPA